jgi:hypothetical protein
MQSLDVVLSTLAIVLFVSPIAIAVVPHRSRPAPSLENLAVAAVPAHP